MSLAATPRNILRIFSGTWFRLRCNALRGSERDARRREKDRGVETQWCSMVRCNLCGSFFPEWDPQSQFRWSFRHGLRESKSSLCESNTPDRVEWFR